MAVAFLIAALLLSSTSLVIEVPASIRVVVGFVQAYYLPGLVFFFFLGDKQRSRVDLCFLPLVLSPIVLSLLLYAAYQLTGSLDASSRLSLLVLYVLLVPAAFRWRHAGTSETPTVPPIDSLMIAALFAGVIAVTAFVNDHVLVRSDAWLHASIANEILDRGLPPFEPNLPDVPLRYMWFYHLFLAASTRLSGLSIFVAMWAFNVVNAFAFPYFIARFASQYVRERRRIVATLLLAIAGLGPVSWVLWPVIFGRALFGEVSGSEEIARILSEIELNGAEVINSLRLYRASIVNLLDKFLTVTAFGYALNLFLFCFVLVLDKPLHRRAPVGTAMNIFLVIVGAFLFHLLTGLTLVVTITGAAILMTFTNRIERGPRLPLFQTLVIPLLSVLAAAVCLPYFASLTGGSEQANPLRDHLHFGHRNLLAIGASLIVLFSPAREALKRIFTTPDAEFRLLASWIVVLFLLSIVVDLPTVAERKLVHFVFLLLTPPLAWEIADRLAAARGSRFVAMGTWVTVLFLLPSVLTIRGFMLDRPESDLERSRYSITEEEKTFFDWIQDATSPTAVIIENNTDNNMPVHAHRRNFYLNPGYISIFGYEGEKIDRYGEIQKELYTGKSLNAGSIEFLRRLNIEFIVVIWREDLEANPDIEEPFIDHPEWFEKVYDSHLVKAYSLLPRT